MKDLIVKNKRILIFLIVFLTFNGFVFTFFKSSVELVIASRGQTANINLFYDNLTDNYPFDDSHMTAINSLPVMGVQKLVFPVSFKSLNKLRIDFGTTPNSFEVYSLTLLKSPIHEVKISGEEFIKRFSGINDISEYSLKDGKVQVNTSGLDGHIYSLDLITKTPLTIRPDLFLHELYWGIISLLSAFIDKIFLLFKSFSLRTLKNNINMYKVSIICIFLFALIVRIDFIDINREFILGSDAATYHFAAENLLKYGMLTYDRNGDIFAGLQEPHPTTVLSPGYPVYLAIIYWVFNHSKHAVLITHIFLSLIIIWLIYKVLNMLNIRKQYVVFILLIASVYPGFLYNIDRMLTEQLFTALFLGFAFTFLKGMQKNSLYLIGVSALCLGFASNIRPLAFPFLIVAAFFLIVYEQISFKVLLKKLSVFILVVILCFLPWWIRNWLTFNTFMFFSDAGVNPKVWGAVPYFMDMGSTYNKSLNDIIKQNVVANPILYYKWRIFGFFQYMWGDLWDENLVHPFNKLRPILIVQQLLIVPCVAAIPLLIKKSRIEIIFITCVPIAYTLMNMPFHGLPRYVYPSIPFVLILAGILINAAEKLFSNNKFGQVEYEPNLFKWQRTFDQWMRKSYFVFSLLFSMVLIYSVYIFAYEIKGEMSEFRLNKYLGITSHILQSKDILEKVKYDYKNILIENASLIVESEKKVYKNFIDAPVLLRIKDKLLEGTENKKVVSKVELNIQGGYIFDYMTVYWTGKNTPEVTENCVYRFPINPMQKTQTIYIDEDVESLLVVPVNFRGGKFTLDSIEITKYLIDKE